MYFKISWLITQLTLNAKLERENKIAVNLVCIYRNGKQYRFHSSLILQNSYLSKRQLHK